jgi:hypothetical protein
LLDDLSVEMSSDLAPQIANLIKLMREVAGIDLEGAKEWYASINALSDIKIGDSITPEQFAEIIIGNPELAKYFTTDFDKGYSLTGGE